MIDYKYGKVYTIRSYSRPDLIYVGSTCVPLFRRLAKHKSSFKAFKNGKYSYVTSFELLKCNDYYIELVEDFPCTKKEQLNARESHFIRTIDCVNKRVSFLTEEEIKAQNKKYKANFYKNHKEEIIEKSADYRKTHKEELKIRKAKYYEENKDEILAKQRKINDCKCGMTFTSVHKTRHEKTKVHQNYLKSLEQISEIIQEI